MLLAVIGWSTVALATDNTTTTFVWGDALRGDSPPVLLARARPVPNNRHRLVAIDAWRSVIALREDGVPIAWGNDTIEEWAIPQEVPLANVVAVAAGVEFHLALTESGEVWTIELLHYPAIQTTLVSLPLPAIAIGATAGAGGAVLDDGTIWTWGSDVYQEQGDGDPSQRTRWTPGPTAPLPAPAIALSGGTHHFVALLEDGTAVGWGSNWYNQLCTGPVGVYETPIALAFASTPAPTNLAEVSSGSQFTLLRGSDGAVYGCGDNSERQLKDHFTSMVYPAEEMSLLRGVVDVDAGDEHSLARTADGEVLVWGVCHGDDCGTTLITNQPQTVLHLRDATAISAGQLESSNTGTFFAVAATPGRDLLATGDNGLGQLGDYSYTSRGEPGLVASEVVAVSGANDHTVAVTSLGTVMATGLNDRGQLGDGTNVSSPGWVVVDLGDAVAVAAGIQFSMALDRNGSVWTWGDNSYGQLGDGTVGAESWNPIRADVGDIVAIAAGHYHAVALDSQGTVWSWGDVSLTELGYPGIGNTGGVPTPLAIEPRMIEISAGYAHTLAVDDGGEVWAFGSNENGQLGNGTVDPWYTDTPPATVRLPARALHVAAGGWLSMALLEDNTVVRWGDEIGNPRYHGCIPEAGYGNPTPTALGLASSALDIAAGWCHGLVLDFDETVWAFGSGTGGELGDGQWADSQVPVKMTVSEVEAIGPAGVHSDILVRSENPTCEKSCW